MKALKTVSSLLATIAMLAMPSAALGEYLVPPGNSAATQYTEAYPTAGGSKNAERNGKQQSRPPAEAIGEQNARKLASQGPDGPAAAEVAAATAPSGPVAQSPDGGDDGGAAGGGGQGGSGTSGPQPASGSAGDGSSGVGEVLAEATGSSSSGGIGLVLPLAIVGAIAWALAYLWRQRKRQTA